MQPSANGFALIELYESLRLTPYLDNSSNQIWTVGWGHALTAPDGRQISVKTFGATQAHALMQQAMLREFGAATCTKEQTDALFMSDCAPHASALTARVATDTTQAQFDAMLCFTFNAGVAGFDNSSIKRLHNTARRNVGQISIHDLWAQAHAMPHPDTIPVAFVEWSHSNGQVSLGLFRRRIAEVLVYSGWDAKQAYDLTQKFTG